ncbi:inhibitor of the pro-sigma K processing machinery [Salinibacillus kushneri]|uniref:Inhibitor of the pro-sigma K processing machinery n=1 Tax=Salinibacillus kushneri TaxID=237682 RepID=A0A1I0C1Z8_9BACI|nr:pro-sigmaK processing inhibitor BofA family protein [Salinibacillus kushneri]SET13389.1 inhibitor of the pro-sigma K processing machinery [Salinibacillus kushneri]
MNSYMIIGLIIAVILIILIKGLPIKTLKIVSQGMVKLLIGALVLFFVNVFGANFGLHIPINLFTTVISGFLGVSGVAALFAIHFMLFP